ncbi:universal stress protein [Modestobacter roseus]|uniref:Nucleotide-binding universal stress UspA family protein n=1 Tax=Modestobacter roseus TaxID=1181884 RepID=A0A562IQC7_9ACTN|nr:universal stress protein [Modestobacter roseus]MQA34356.1 universal stress protein [Modestobacter roseus]TWH72923.1 nucleotide-binding universal stress UspA family protein [Modestobacter roseus]
MSSTAGRSPDIVVAVDGSPSAQEALRWAVGQAEATGGELHAVTAWHQPETYGWGVVVDGVDWAENGRAVLDQALAATLDPAAAAAVHRHVVEGHAVQVLLDAAADADLLVVGSRGHGGFTGMLLGSVSQHLVAHSPCPVVVVRAGRRDAETQPATAG